MKIVSIIPIKLNNERLPGKNIKILHGKPLIQYISEILLAIPQINERYVYCSNIEITNYLPKGMTFLMRPDYLDLPTSNFTQIFDCFAKEVDADIYVYAHATAPFLSVQSISTCINAVVSGVYDSAFTARKIQDYLWEGAKPLNFDPSHIPRSQDLPIIYQETSGVYVFTREMFERLQRRVGVCPYIHEVSLLEAVDINTGDDFAVAEVLSPLNNRNHSEGVTIL